MILRDFFTEAANPAQQAAIAIAMKKAHKTPKTEGMAEGAEQQYLWHGSRQKIPVLEPRQSVDTGGAAGSNQNAIYATSDPKVAIAMGLTTPGSDTGMFPNDPQMVLFSGKIRKGENVYLHKVPMNGPDGKPQFVQGGNSREFHSVPGVKGIKPTEIKAVPVDKYLNLIRQATPADLELRKKYMKQGVAEACWPGYHKDGMKTMFGKRYPNCVKNKKTTEDTIQEFIEETLGQKNSDEIRRIQQMLNKKFQANLDVDGVLGPLTRQSIRKFLPSADTAPAPDPERTTAVQGLKNKSVQEQQCPKCGGPAFSDLILAEKQDACYHKVKSRYKVWPSAYASGALVQCRKKGAANWGNKSKK